MKKIIPMLSIALLSAGTLIAAPKAVKGKKPAGLKFKVQQLRMDNNEGVAVGDINGDGKLDVVAGEYWYAAPDFKGLKIRTLETFGKDYMMNNSDHLLDVDGDGDLDVVAGGFTVSEVFWYENPGKGKYEGEGWKGHLLADTGTSHNEISYLHDIDGDGKPEYFENSWKDDSPMDMWTFAKDGEGKPVLKKHTISASGNGHGMGFGDINGDGKQDILYKDGWYEQPAAGPTASAWKYHNDFTMPHGSCPSLVVDLNKDGKNDIIWADGHNYGVYWMEQQDTQKNGQTTWRIHEIDKKFSQAHALAWEDIDNDGQPELITGKRYFAHSGSDPGSGDKATVHYYDWDGEAQTWSKPKKIAQGESGKAPGIGLQIRVIDMDGDGWKEVVVPGKSGTHIIWNKGK
ncbi:MAG: FG-GAP-like repeat-containing protein [Verrucomicrobiota bacterium]